MNNTEILISLSKTELQNINGGEVPRAYYMDQDVINQNWDNLCTLGGVFRSEEQPKTIRNIQA